MKGKLSLNYNQIILSAAQRMTYLTTTRFNLLLVP